MTAVIIVVGLIAFLFLGPSDGTPTGNGTKPTPIISQTSRIPVRVIDPLGDEDDNIDDIIASMENAEEEISAEMSQTLMSVLVTQRKTST
jgi:hypothetical protein